MTFRGGTAILRAHNKPQNVHLLNTDIAIIDLTENNERRDDRVALVMNSPTEPGKPRRLDIDLGRGNDYALARITDGEVRGDIEMWGETPDWNKFWNFGNNEPQKDIADILFSGQASGEISLRASDVIIRRAKEYLVRRPPGEWGVIELVSRDQKRTMRLFGVENLSMEVAGTLTPASARDLKYARDTDFHPLIERR